MRRKGAALGVRLAMAGIVLGGVLAMATSAGAETIAPDPQHPVIVISGRADVLAGETVAGVVIFDGPLVMSGTVNGDAVAFNGDILIQGTVNGDVAALNGRVTVTRAAHVSGDVISSEVPVIAPGTVAGQVRQQGFRFTATGATAFGRFAIWLAATVSSFLIGLLLTLLLPKAADAIEEAALRRAGPSVGWGVLFALGLPFLALILIVTLVGGLLGLGLGLAMLLLYSVAYTAGAFALGRLIIKPPRARFLGFFVGWAILRVGALVPVIGGLLLLATVVWGLGAIVVAGFRSGRGGPSAGAPPAPMPPPPPMPALPQP
jgi:hypothetical protein